MQLSLSIDEVAKVTGIGKTKVYEAINLGRLPARKYGKKTLVLRRDLEFFLENLALFPIKN